MELEPVAEAPASEPALRLEILRSHEEMHDALPRWRELHARIPEANIFYHPIWIESWLETLGEDREPLVLVVRETSGAWRVAWPFFAVETLGGQGLWPLGAHCGDNFTPLVNLADEAAQDLLLAAMADLLKEFLFIWVPLIPEEPARQCYLPRLTASNVPVRFRPRTENLRLHLPKGIDYDTFLREVMGKKSRYNYRRAEKHLRNLGQLAYRLIEDPEEVALLMPTLVRIERASWKGQKGLNLMEPKPVRRFYRDLLPRAAQAGVLRLNLLELDGDPMAYELSFVSNGVYALHNQAYLPAYGEHSPGMLIFLHSLAWAFQHQIPIMDFLQGEQSHKLRFANEHRMLHDMALFAPTLRGHLYRSLFGLSARFTDRRRKG